LGHASCPYFGRPYISYPTVVADLQFNLSHTDGLVACVVGKSCEIGVDVENIWRDLDPAAIAPTVFSPMEVARLITSPPEERRGRFFSYWTLKEAYIKARGMGLSIPLDAFWFDLDGPTPRVRFTDRCPDQPERWRFCQYMPTAAHKVALAVATRPGTRLDLRLHWVVPLASYRFQPDAPSLNV